MKIIGTILVMVGLGIGVLWIWNAVKANYEWENSVLSNWTLADKSSTLDAKSAYINKFVVALESSNLADNNALIYKTADNNCLNNIQAIKTLEQRLNQIKGMDETSFQYQQAIQQITSQEQGEATPLINILHGCWMKTHHYVLWNGWFTLPFMLSIVVSLIVGFVLIFS